MARQIAEGELETAWFARHGSTPITEIPAHWPDDYRAVVERRIALIETRFPKFCCDRSGTCMHNLIC
jgi:hypothetical protein